MPEPARGLRPQLDTFQGEGWQLSVVDAPQIFAAAARHPLELLHGATFPAPVRQARMSIRSGDEEGEPVFIVEAGIRTGNRPHTPRPSFAALGNDPLGVLLSRRAGIGDERAMRVVHGLETAVGEVTRMLGIPPQSPPDRSWEASESLRSHIVISEATGLRTTVAHHAPVGAEGADAGRLITLRAALPTGVMAPAHLAALFDVLVQMTRDLSGTASGDHAEVTRTFILSQHAGGAPGHEPEQVSLDQVGGLDGVVAQFREIAISFRHPEAMARWGARRPQGILLHGPPGTGKTMLARALASEIGGTMREIRTPEILDKWLGASERNMKRIFREARQYRVPTVMLFDEFDSIISYAGAGVDSGSNAVNAVAGIFKQEMNNLIEENPNVIVVATTNFPHLIDDSLIRSGRFDVRLEIPMPDAGGREQILTRMIRALIAEHEIEGFQMFADDIDVGEIASLSAGMSGADLREVLRRAQMLKAMQEARTGIPATPIGQADLLDRVVEIR